MTAGRINEPNVDPAFLTSRSGNVNIADNDTIEDGACGVFQVNDTVLRTNGGMATVTHATITASVKDSNPWAEIPGVWTQLGKSTQRSKLFPVSQHITLACSMVNTLMPRSS